LVTGGTFTRYKRETLVLGETDDEDRDFFSLGFAVTFGKPVPKGQLVL
jgi:hypothetical protein